MKWFWIVVAVGAAVLAARWWWAARAARSAHATELGEVRRLTEDDAACLGEQLEHLEVAEQALDDEGRSDHRSAVEPARGACPCPSESPATSEPCCSTSTAC